MVAVLVGCGVRRDEAARLAFRSSNARAVVRRRLGRQTAVCELYGCRRGGRDSSWRKATPLVSANVGDYL